MPDSPSAPKVWLLAARPKTLIAGIAPVLIGAAAAKQVDPLLFSLCLLFSVLIQIGANFANDYFDYLKGADTIDRVGPQRAAQSGWIAPPVLKQAACGMFLLAACLSLPLLIRIGWQISLLMPLTILFALLYTGGPRPLGYLGLGDLLVFIFYGPVATIATYYALTLQLDLSLCLVSISPGLLSTAILTANNLRDEKTDRMANKKTVVVRFGQKWGQWEYLLCIVIAIVIPPLLACSGLAPKTWLLTLIALPLSIPTVKAVFRARTGIEFAPLLPAAALQLALFTALFLTACLL